MDFYSLKRKKLQALCKKHGIPANKTNLEMAKLLTLTLQITESSFLNCIRETGELISEDDRNAVNAKKKVRFSPDDEIREYETSGYRMEGRRGTRRASLANTEITANHNLSNKVLGKKKGRLNEKVGRTTRSRAELDKESSSCMIQSESLEVGDEVEASLETGEDIVKYSMPAVGLRRSRRKSVVGKVQQLKEEVKENVAYLNNKVQRRYSRRNSVAAANKMNETAARIGQRKRKCEAEAIQGIETSIITYKSLVGQPTRRSSRLASKRVNNREKSTSKIPIVVEETTFNSGSIQNEVVGLSKHDCTNTSTEKEDGGLSMQDAKSLDKKGKSSGERSVASVDDCTLQLDAGKEMDSPKDSEDIVVLAPINLESTSTGEAFKIASQSLLAREKNTVLMDDTGKLIPNDCIEDDANYQSSRNSAEITFAEFQEKTCDVVTDANFGEIVLGENGGDDLNSGPGNRERDHQEMQQNSQASYDRASYEENIHIIAKSKGVKMVLMGDDRPKTVETRMDRLSRISQEDREDETIEDEEIIMGENDTAQIACEDLIDPSNCSRIDDNAIDHQEVAKDQIDPYNENATSECKVEKPSDQENEALELNMFFGKDEEFEVEKPSEQPLEFNLTSGYARESIEKVKITESDGEQVAEYQDGQCEHQTEGPFLTISDDATFDQAKEPEVQDNRSTMFDDIQDSIAHELQENKSVEVQANVNIAVENEQEIKLMDVVPKTCEMTFDQFSEFGQEVVKDQVMEDVELIIGENGGAQIAGEDTNYPADNSNQENSVRDHQEVPKEQSNIQQGISENLAFAEQKEFCTATPDKVDREAEAAGDVASSVVTNYTLHEMVGSKQSSSSNREVSKPAEILLFADACFGEPEFASVSFLAQENPQTSNDFEDQEREEISFRENDRTLIACKDLEDPASCLCIGSTTRNHQAAAKGQINVHTDSQAALMDDHDSLTLNKLFCENDNQIQSGDSGEDEVLIATDFNKADNDIPGVISPLKDEPVVDSKTSSAVRNSLVKEKEASEQNLLLGEEEEYEIEKSSEQPSQFSLTREGDDRVLPENVMIREPASKQEHQMEGFCLSVSDGAKFEEAKEQQSVPLCCGADQGDGTNCKSTLKKLIGSDEGITTFRVFDWSAIKENAMSMKKSKVGDLTAPKTLMKRRPLEEVTKKA